MGKTQHGLQYAHQCAAGRTLARQVMTTAVETAVSQVTGRGAARAPAKRRAAAGNSR